MTQNYSPQKHGDSLLVIFIPWFPSNPQQKSPKKNKHKSHGILVVEKKGDLFEQQQKTTPGTYKSPISLDSQIPADKVF